MEEVMSSMDFLFQHPFHAEIVYPSMAHALHDKMQLNIPFADFERICKGAVLTHDLGKSSGEFQTMLWSMEHEFQQTGKEPPPSKRYKQAYRHEFVSALLLTNAVKLEAVAPIKTWAMNLVQTNPIYYRIMVAGAFGHHRKTRNEKAFNERVLTDRGYTPKCIHLRLLSEEMQTLDPTFPSLQDVVLTANMREFEAAKVQMKAAYSGKQDAAYDAVFDAVKWMVILADVYGSIHGAREQVFDKLRDLSSPRFIDYAARMKGYPLRGFQATAGQDGNLMLLAPTGAGKTLAIYNWASIHPELHLIFSTPTTDTATSLFQDYRGGNDVVRHSRAYLDQLQFTATPDEDDKAETEGIREVCLQLTNDISFCTVDQVVGIMACYAKSIMWLPYLLCSQIVFDEFHSYDSTLRSFHTQFLKRFPKIRTAHMSATIHEARKKEVVNLANISASQIVEEQSQVGRYRIQLVTNPRLHFKPGNLWIVNTVDRAISLGRDFPDATVYHSRFKYPDRKAICNRLVTAFKTTKDIRAIATQVAEMSLDISALELITEICPPDSFIQRLGRVNRGASVSGVADVFVYIPKDDTGKPSSLPYDGDMESWIQFLTPLLGQEISQEDLAAAYLQYTLRPENALSYNAEKVDRLETGRTSLRDFDPKVRAVLRSDRNEKYLEMVEIPIYMSAAVQAEKHALNDMVKHRFIVDYNYDPRLGLLVQNV